MKTETFIFSFNGVKIAPMTMADAIEMARKKAIDGRTVRLRIGNVLLGTYSPDPASPITYTDPNTRKTSLVECCKINLVPLANKY